jgi:integrase/recombinase XerD
MSQVTTTTNGVQVSGPLAPLAAGFRSALIDAGHRSWRQHLLLMAHLSRWLEGRGLTAADLSADRVTEYLAGRRAAGYNWLYSQRAVTPLLRYLAGQGVLGAEDPVPVPEAEKLLARFGWL